MRQILAFLCILGGVTWLLDATLILSTSAPGAAGIVCAVMAGLLILAGVLLMLRRSP